MNNYNKKSFIKNSMNLLDVNELASASRKSYKINKNDDEKKKQIHQLLHHFFMVVFLLMIILALFINLGFAAAQKNKADKPEKSYPTGCKTVGYKFSNGAMILTPVGDNQPQTIYFIQNKSNQDIALMQQRNGTEPYIMHHDNMLKANQWAAFATNLRDVKFICINSKDTTTTIKSILDCGNILKVCEYPNVKFPISNRGSYWAATNMSMSELVHEVIHQGMLLKS